MNVRKITWLPTVRRKLISFRSGRFTPVETLDFISQLVLETESLLSNHVLTKGFTEVSGQFSGINRIVVRRFRFYYECSGNEFIVVGVLFPGEK